MDPWKNSTQWCKDEDLRDSLLNGTHLRTRLPAIGEKTVARFIFDLRQANNSLVSTPRKPCFVVPRVLIGPEESSPEEVSKQKVDGFDPMSFHTLRFRKFKGKSLSYTGKCLVDVRGYVRKVVTNPHKISHSQCLGNAFPEFSSSLLKVHHYTGSFETFATHRGNSLEEVSEVRAPLRRIYRATYLSPHSYLDHRCGKTGQFGHLLGPTTTSKAGSSLLSPVLEWKGPES